MVKLILRLKAGESVSVRAIRSANIPIMLMSIQDFLSPATKQPNGLFHRIAAAGGLHKFYEYNGEIILSSIAKDELLPHFGVNEAVDSITKLKPNSFVSFDGETYEREFYLKDNVWYYDGKELAKREIDRCLQLTQELQEKCPDIKIIGLVKGFGEDQIKYHLSKLQELGIDEFMLHVSDFSRHGSKSMISKAKSYASIIRGKAKKLYLYGMGSPNNLTSFSFADYYVTFNHFVTARFGRVYQGTKRVPYNGSYNSEYVIKNLMQMYRNIERLKAQTKLTDFMEGKWEAVREQDESAMLRQLESMEMELVH